MKSQADFDGMLLCCKPRISNVFTCTSLEAWETNALAHPLDTTYGVSQVMMVDTEAAFAVMFGATRSRGQRRLK